MIDDMEKMARQAGGGEERTMRERERASKCVFCCKCPSEGGQLSTTAINPDDC
jgi:hypothetical protein